MGRQRWAVLVGVGTVVAGLISGGSASAQSAACANSDAQPGSVSNAELGTAVTCLINAQRASFGVAQLTVSPKLVSAETGHVDDMLTHRYLGHRGTDGSLPAVRAQRAGFLRHYRSFAVGENLATGQTGAATPQKVVNAWMNSPTHRRNVIDPRFRQIGTVVETGSPTGVPGSALDQTAATYGVTFGVVRRH